MSKAASTGRSNSFGFTAETPPSGPTPFGAPGRVRGRRGTTCSVAWSVRGSFWVVGRLNLCPVRQSSCRTPRPAAQTRLLRSHDAPPRPSAELDRGARHHVLRGARAAAPALRVRVRPLEGRGGRAVRVAAERARGRALRPAAGRARRRLVDGGREPRLRLRGRRLDARGRTPAAGGRQRPLLGGRARLPR